MPQNHFLLYSPHYQPHVKIKIKKVQNIKRQRTKERSAAEWHGDANCVALAAGYETQTPTQFYK